MFDYVDEKGNLKEDEIINDLKSWNLSLLKEERKNSEGKPDLAIIVWPKMKAAEEEETEEEVAEEKSLGLTELK